MAQPSDLSIGLSVGLSVGSSYVVK